MEKALSAGSESHIKYVGDSCANSTASQPKVKNLPRTLIEFCCGPNSKLCDERFPQDGCICHRITEYDDIRTDKGKQTAIDIISKSPYGSGLLWASLPCTAGCGYWGYNIKNPGGPEKFDEHMDLHDDMVLSLIHI